MRARPAPEYSFSLQTLKAALPPECFERSPLQAVGQLVQTIFTTSAMLWAVQHTPWFLLPVLYAFLAFSMYGFLAVGHECAHGSFASSHLVNDVLGSVCMLAGLMPFENWRQGHMEHHRWTAHDELEEYFTYSHKSDRALRFIRGLMKWMPPIGLFVMHMMYLLGLRGKRGVLWTKNLYFNAELNKPLSYVNLAMHAMQGGALAYGLAVAPLWTVQYALLPLMGCGAANLMIGYLQHRDDAGHLAAFDRTTWTKLRGAMQTIDRSFWPFDFLIHGAARYHVLHHLFPTIPHYRGAQAMAAIQALLAEHYHFDRRSAMIAYHPALRASYLVEDAGGSGVLTFRP